MSEIKLFKINSQKVVELSGKTIELEKSLQEIIEKNLETFLGVRFLRSEYPTSKVHGGRVDTLGLDENGCPVIIEYKRAINENIINQGLYYLDWLLDHKADFKLLVMEAMGKSEADEIDWTAPRLICIAANYTKYDEYAVRQINRNIDLVRYRRFEDDLIALELVYSNTASEIPADESDEHPKSAKKGGDKTVTQWFEELDQSMLDIYAALRSFLLALGDDVSEKQLKLYIAYRRIKNFACMVFQKKAVLVYVKLNPDNITLEPGFTRDVRRVGHWATGDLEITIRNRDDLRKAESLIARSYEEA